MVHADVATKLATEVAEEAITEEMKEQARNRISAAQKQLLSSEGIRGGISWRFFKLVMTKIVIAKPVPFIVAGIIAIVACHILLYGVISAVYGAFMLKALPSVLLNTLLSIINTIWFAVHALKELLMMSFTHIINVTFHFFLNPIVTALDTVIGWLPGLSIPKDETLLVSLSHNFNPLPETMLSYAFPDPVFWGDWNSLISYTWVVPGEVVYHTPYLIVQLNELRDAGFAFFSPGFVASIESLLTDVQMKAMLGGYDVADATYVLAGTQNGASVWAPEYNHAAISPDGIFSPVDRSGSVVPYNAANYVKHIEQYNIVTVAYDFFDSIVNVFSSGPITYTIPNTEAQAPATTPFHYIMALIERIRGG
jgi:hypothetical protein